MAKGIKLGKKCIMRMMGRCKKYPPPKYLLFCKFLFEKQFRVYLHEAKTTNSKYVTIARGRQEVKIRFSDHRPNKHVQERADSDFYVGISNGITNTTRDAYYFVMREFGN